MFSHSPNSLLFKLVGHFTKPTGQGVTADCEARSLTTTEGDAHQAQAQAHGDGDLQVFPLSSIISGPHSTYTHNSHSGRCAKNSLTSRFLDKIDIYFFWMKPELKVR